MNTHFSLKTGYRGVFNLKFYKIMWKTQYSQKIGISDDVFLVFWTRLQSPAEQACVDLGVSTRELSAHTQGPVMTETDSVRNVPTLTEGIRSYP